MDNDLFNPNLTPLFVSLFNPSSSGNFWCPMVYFQSCLLSQAQRDTSDQDNYQILDYWLTMRYRCIVMWSWTGLLIFFSAERKDWMNSASYEYRNISGRRGVQLVPIGMPTFYWKTFPRRPRNVIACELCHLHFTCFVIRMFLDKIGFFMTY